MTFLGTGEEIHFILLKVQPSLEVCFPELWVPGETVSTELGIRRQDLLAVAGHGLITPTTLSTVQDLLAVAGHGSIPQPLSQQFRSFILRKSSETTKKCLVIICLLKPFYYNMVHNV